MGRVRRFGPFGWRIAAVNGVFGGCAAVLLAVCVVLANSSAAMEPPVALLTIGGTGIRESEVVEAPPVGKDLPTPEAQVGVYRPYDNLAFLYGHSTGVFASLPEAMVGTEIELMDLETGEVERYRVTYLETYLKAEIRMLELLAKPLDGRDHLVLMTCAGEQDERMETWDARLVVYAVAV